MQSQSQSKTSGSRKKRFEVVAATTRPDLHIDVGKVERKFGTSGMIINDPGEAEAIDQKYGSKGTKEVVVMGVDDIPREPGHKYQFTVPEMPWKREKENGQEGQAGFEGGANVSPGEEEKEEEVQ